jgi:hypothetical protein
MEYPRLVYKSASIFKLVDDDSEYANALSAGWFKTVPEALKEKSDNNEPTRAELEQKAKELGVKFDGRTSDEKLLRLINELV